MAVCVPSTACVVGCRPIGVALMTSLAALQPVVVAGECKEKHSGMGWGTGCYLGVGPGMLLLS
jgi:hypothetical protein